MREEKKYDILPGVEIPDMKKIQEAASDFSISEVGDVDSKLKSDETCVRFLEKFESLNGSYICNELLDCDIRTKEGVEYAVENNLFTEFCPKMVESDHEPGCSGTVFYR